jgi:uncharacterized protein (DUF1499 family)
MSRQRIPLSPTTLTVIGEQPYSRSAIVGRNLGAFAVLLTMVALIFHSFGAADTPSFLMAFTVSLGIGTLAMLFSMRAFSIIWARGKRGLGDAIIGICYGVVLWLVPLVIFAIASSHPRVTDVTTQGDLTPEFIVVEGVRPDWANPVGLDAVMPAPLARPLVTDVSLPEAYDLVMGMITTAHWDVIAESAPDDKKPTFASIQAASTSAFGFTDDIVVQLTTEGKRTRIDMRSASRVGKFDLGINAQRIDDFLLAVRQKLNER